MVEIMEVNQRRAVPQDGCAPGASVVYFVLRKGIPLINSVRVKIVKLERIS